MKTYRQEENDKNMDKIKELCTEVPDYVVKYIKYINGPTESSTRLKYLRDIYGFLEYIADIKDVEGTIKDVSIDIIDNLTPDEINDYLLYLERYEKGGTEIKNEKISKMRKLSSIRGLYSYLFEMDMITHNPSVKVPIPKPEKKEISIMDTDESADLLKAAEFGSNLKGKRKEYHDLYGLRDTTILLVFLGTGIRVSELVGLDIKDINLKRHSMKVVRKGNKEDIVYYSDELTEYLRDYLEYRKHQYPMEGHENALFLSSQRKRIGVRTVELLVKKYTMESGIIKHTTPHTLRRTFGTRLYESSSDLYLVSETLGHSSVETTRKHYARMSEERKKAARNIIKPE
jgi:Site-specific recombinase XerD